MQNADIEEGVFTFDYVNHRGEKGRRRIAINGWRASIAERDHPYHPGQFILVAFDLDKRELRDFAIKDMILGGERSDLLEALADMKIANASLSGIIAQNEKDQLLAAKAEQLSRLRQANTDRQVLWTEGTEPPDLSFRANETAGEAGEAIDALLDTLGLGLTLAASVGRMSNVAKKLVREEKGWVGSRATDDDLASELADIVICVDLIGLKRRIDLWSAIVAKFNATSVKVNLPTRLA